MQLAKFRQADGRVGVGLVESDVLVPIVPAEGYPSLASILESPDPPAPCACWPPRRAAG